MSTTYQQLNTSLDTLKLFQMKEHLEEVSNFVSQNKLSFSDGLLKSGEYILRYEDINGNPLNNFDVIGKITV